MAAMGARSIPILDPEWVKLVEPTLPEAHRHTAISIDAARRGMAELDAAKVLALDKEMPELKKGLEISNIMVAMRDGEDLEMRIFKPENGESLPVYLGYHGGGWSAGSNDSEELLNRNVSKTLKVIVFSLAYRLAPEHPFPVPFNDAEDGLKWVYENASRFGGDVKKGFVCGGTSSGGHLAALATFRAQEHGIPVSGCFSRAPMVLNRSVAKESWKETLDILPKDVYTPLLNWETCERFYEYMSIPLEELTNPANFPIFANSFEKFPRTYMQVPGIDPLSGEGVLYEKVLRENGVETKIDLYPNMPHPFHNFPQLTTARKSIADAMTGLRWLFRF
ncbi:hypothetical protein V499_08030 [Pseudogymnoascus sp. VKM F-103]|uniref:Alpha/beta hydrolase fold-3 domain-containing protein n=1 Tax=Pseudogymnoascus verrucosus TaxID=342668 RepID=A0A1B8GRE8_9PEZI|nr:uncharacterized protein VE01_03181 [Pseudogymnoascus verrucosus]KFY71794.1 hypothetical protein V499_08030 [Pseudogymnoascus sp. VKM F-103]OBT98407.1 hypothetical protein VE01_03181 [Pseudogymnoascus verrucosus]